MYDWGPFWPVGRHAEGMVYVSVGALLPAARGDEAGVGLTFTGLGGRGLDFGLGVGEQVHAFVYADWPGSDDFIAGSCRMIVSW